MDNNISNKNSTIESNHFNKNFELDETAATLHIEHKNISRVGVANIMVILDNILTDNVEIKQSDNTKNEIPKLKREKHSHGQSWQVIHQSMNTFSWDNL